MSGGPSVGDMLPPGERELAGLGLPMAVIRPFPFEAPGKAGEAPGVGGPSFFELIALTIDWRRGLPASFSAGVGSASIDGR